MSPDLKVLDFSSNLEISIIPSLAFALDDLSDEEISYSISIVPAFPNRFLFFFKLVGYFLNEISFSRSKTTIVFLLLRESSRSRWELMRRPAAEDIIAL